MTATPLQETPLERIQRRRAMLDSIREKARKLFLQTGVHGTQVASMISEALDKFVVQLVEESLHEFPEADRAQIKQHSAMIVTGGSGRGEVAPFSDLDVLFVFRPKIMDRMERLSQVIVPAFWDAGIKLGQRVHTVADTVDQARQDSHLATSLVTCRYLWGDEALSKQLEQKFFLRVVKRRMRQFIEDCIKGRTEERDQHGASSQQLEPDVKKSLGGLRDVHLLQWIGFAYFQTANIEDLRLLEGLSNNDAARLKAAVEYLTRIRIDLHLHAGKPQDVLSKDEQLRIAEARELPQQAGRRPVEVLMQEFFTHSMAIAEISKRFVAYYRRRSVGQWLQRSLLTNRVNNHFLLRPDELDVVPSHLDAAVKTLDDIVRVYHSAAMYRVALSPRLLNAIKERAQTLPPGPSPLAGRLFMEILDATGRLGTTIRSMHETNVLELIIPEWKHIRCLLQFNQYHHFTVDEHSLQCLEFCEKFGQEDSAVGAAYRGMKSKAIQHLAVLIHDIGKGFVEDHCLVGQRMAFDICARLCLTTAQTETIAFLIRRHLEMTDLALRHDITDPRILLEFSHKLGSPERLDLLYVLSAADLSGVGPGVWTPWKAELLGQFHTQLTYILSGQQPRFHEEERLRKVREHVYRAIVPLECEDDPDGLKAWVDEQLNGFTSYYLSTTPPSRIASDVDIIRGLRPGEIRVDGRYEPETGHTHYRVVLDNQHSTGCFHMIAGVLTAKHMDILGAEITTTNSGVVVDVFHVIDGDYSTAVPEHRLEEVGQAIREVLVKKTTVEQLFRRHKRFVMPSTKAAIMELETRVTLDNDTSDRATVVSVFANDRPGLLYTITRALFQLGLSVDLAKIATHFDQVVDVFYVTDNSGHKIDNEARRETIQARIAHDLAEFEDASHKEFVS